MVTVERTNDPALFELGQPASCVQRSDLHDGLQGAGDALPNAQLTPPELARGLQPFEPVDELEPIILLKHARLDHVAKLLRCEEPAR